MVFLPITFDTTMPRGEVLLTETKPRQEDLDYCHNLFAGVKLTPGSYQSFQYCLEKRVTARSIRLINIGPSAMRPEEV